MTRLEKIELAIKKNIIYDENTGKVYGVKGKELKSKLKGYVVIRLRQGNKQYHLFAHQFAYYKVYGKIVSHIDHRDGDKSNNKISNLREVTHQENLFNMTRAKGYSFNKKLGKYQSYIRLNTKLIHLGYFNTPEEARQAYLDAKKIYHKI